MPSCSGGCGPGLCVEPEQCKCPQNTVGPRCEEVRCSQPPNIADGRILKVLSSRNLATFSCNKDKVTNFPYPRTSSGLLTCIDGHWAIAIKFYVAKSQLPTITKSTSFSLNNTYMLIARELSKATDESGAVISLLHKMTNENDSHGYVFIGNHAYFVSSMNAKNNERFENLLYAETSDLQDEYSISRLKRSTGKTESSPMQNDYENLLDYVGINLEDKITISRQKRTALELGVPMTYMLTDDARPLQCVPRCNELCEPYGTCDAEHGTCECKEGFSGEKCEIRSCLNNIAVIEFGLTTLSFLEAKTQASVKISCLTGFKFADDISEITGECVQGSWKFNKLVNETQTCHPKCDQTIMFNDDGSMEKNETGFMSTLGPKSRALATIQNNTGCLNGGVCENINLCSCPKGFTGSFCQHIDCPTDLDSFLMINTEIEYKTSSENHNGPPKARIVCTNTQLKTYDLSCRDGVWSSLTLSNGKENYTAFVASNSTCPPVCTVPCVNGGQCVGNDLCLCTSEFTGKDCGDRRCMKDISSIILHGSVSQVTESDNATEPKTIDILTCSEGYMIPGLQATQNTTILITKSRILCRQGVHILEATGQEVTSGTCVPRCQNPCQNGGACEAPNTCRCTQEFTGKSCEKKACFVKKDEVLIREGESLYLKCPAGKFISRNISVVEVVCSDGVFLADSKSIALGDVDTANSGARNTAEISSEVTCVEGCRTSCLNRGVCSGINTCKCTPEYDGPLCELKKCPQVSHVIRGQLSYHNSRAANLTCDVGFSFETGDMEVEVICRDGSWGMLVASDENPVDSGINGGEIFYPLDTICTANCRTECLNGGTCVPRDKCACPEKFHGTLCEIEICDLMEFANGSIVETSGGYEATCDEGFFFASGLSVMSAVCEDRLWKFPSSDQNKQILPSCIKGCPSECLNGGKCVGLQACECSGEYVGERCQDVGCSDLYPSLKHGVIQSSENGTMIHCNEGYIFPAHWNAGQVFCDAGRWKVRVVDPESDGAITDCIPDCSVACHNGGTCLGEALGCRCPTSFTGRHCQHLSCLDTRPEIPQPVNITEETTVYPFLKTYQCLDGFFFNNGAKSQHIYCQNGIWVIQDTGIAAPITELPKCSEGCPRGCGNGGSCMGPNTCVCLKGFEGERCENLACEIPSPSELNGNIMTNGDGSRYLVCHEGYSRPDGSMTAQVHCKAGIWTGTSEGTSTTSSKTHVTCGPKCDPPCKNHGVCVSPDRCECRPENTGPRCADFICSKEPPKAPLNAKIEKRSTNEVSYLCDEGYRFVTGLSRSLLKCLEAGWSLVEEDGEVSKIQPQNLVCEKPKTCIDPPPAVKNSALEYKGSDLETPMLRCYKGYSLLTGDKEFAPSCVNGDWVLTISQKQGCLPECPLGCQNKGVCVAPSVCQCQQGYGGPQCQNELCLQPIRGNNLTVTVRESSVIASCEHGYIFKNGESTIAMDCKAGAWVYPPGYEALVCVAVCVPACENGGICTAPGTCACDENYSGQHCQNKEACASGMPQLPHSLTENVGGGFYRVKCEPSFVFSSDVKWLELRCQLGNWSYAGYANQSSLPQCVPMTGKVCEPKEGKSCGMLYDPQCEIQPPKIQNAIVSYNSSGGMVTCDEGYYLNNSRASTPFKCRGDVWAYPECDTDDPPICEPRCKIPCQNGAKCTGPETCSCPPGFTGKYCSAKIQLPCVSPPPPVPNAAVQISSRGQFVVCARGYKFLSDRLKEEIWCKDGEWMFQTRSTSQRTRACYPICSTECLNGGECTAPDVCTCVHPFTGSDCGIPDERNCWTISGVARNALVVYNSTQMTSRCADGYISTIDNVVAEPPIWNQTCEAGKWKDDQRQFPSRLSTSDADPRPTNLPDASPILQRNCTAICERFCLNGGVCVEPNRCECPPGYSGQNCGTTQPKNCTDLPPVVPRAYLSYRYPENEVVVQCLPGYAIKKGITRTSLVCSNGSWFTILTPQNESKIINSTPTTSPRSASYPGNNVWAQRSIAYETAKIIYGPRSPGSKYAEQALYPVGSLACSAVCQKPCLNNGVCVAPEKCKCPDGFAGDHCQVKKCSGAPEKIQNSMMIFSDDFLNGVSRCRSGYKLPNGDIAAGFDCVDGMWIYQEEIPVDADNASRSSSEKSSYTNLTSSTSAPYPSCLPVCSPPCLNGGWCAAPGTCTCTEGFYGDMCNLRYSRTVNGSSCVFPFVFRGTRRYSRTVNGSSCVFPFVFRGTRHFGCTGAGHSVPWCATAVTDTEEVVAWDVCVADLGMKKVVLTEDHKQCVFPFVYRGTEYHRCTTTERGRGWCATQVHQKVMVKWSYCAADQGGKLVALTSEGIPCQLPFQYGNQAYLSCVDDTRSPWCVVGEKHSVSTSLLRDGSYVTSPQTEIVYGVCLAHWGHKKVQVTRQGHLCTFPFEFEDRMHSTCVYNSSAPPGFRLWCATEVTPSGHVVKSGICFEENDTPRLSSTLLVEVYPHLNLIFPSIQTLGNRWCVFPFSYNKKLYTTCTQAPIIPGSMIGGSMQAYFDQNTDSHRGHYWCATSLALDGSPIEYDICDPNWQAVYKNFTRSLRYKTNLNQLEKDILVKIETKKGHFCSVPFVYQGLQYYGCVTVEAGKSVRPWCAISVTTKGSPILTDECVPNWDLNYPASALKPLPVLPRDASPSSSLRQTTDTIITASGVPCIIPFLYQGLVHSSCIGDTKPWCPTQLDATGAPLAWDYCPESLSNATRGRTDGLPPAPLQAAHTFTVKGLRCVFPFVYEGVTYETCASVGGGRLWCATEVDVFGAPTSIDDCITSDDSSNRAAVVMTRSGFPCIFPFYYDQHHFSACTYYSTNRLDLIKSNVFSSFDPAKLSSTPGHFTFTPPHGDGNKFAPGVLRDTERFPRSMLDGGHKDFAAISQAEVARLSGINSGRHAVKEDTAWCAVAVSLEGVVTMKSECVGNFETDIGDRTFQAFYTSSLQENFGRPKTHDVNLMEKFLKEDESAWSRALRGADAAGQPVQTPPFPAANRANISDATINIPRTNRNTETTAKVDALKALYSATDLQHPKRYEGEHESILEEGPPHAQLSSTYPSESDTSFESWLKNAASKKYIQENAHSADKYLDSYPYFRQDRAWMNTPAPVSLVNHNKEDQRPRYF
ncbi:uncharacterized protein LOC108668644 [Hyalella azteca]|uniref:Uncharacterized protein LOC108668644 n=1 Tax=Hyalella azteca TaxID=294128 RepID=A0A979FL16_HYAAZ|nr:uncharacterized protein LOC108668644 [Hyalella azteca]